MVTNLYTFWKLINECRIEIPTIQRDYTYGRKNAKEISIKLISSILDALNIDEKELHLNFVYGKKLGLENYKALERNKSSIDTLLQTIRSYAENLNLELEYTTNQKSTKIADIVTFIPLDGQQRLTTLFLIHWYMANLNKDDSVKSILNRFNYATRKSSSDFLSMICNTNHFEAENETSISDNIENHENFFAIWKKDPTVSSMLTVLNEIQKQFREKNMSAKDCWENIINKSKVTFDFFDLDDFELTDELYLKMNARGINLTNFEKFKSWLIKNNTENISVEDWKKKLDINWNDIFWKEKEVEQTKIDIAYLQYFKNMFLGDYILLNKKSEIEKDETVDLLRLSDEFNPINVFENTTIFSQKINDYLSLLDLFSANDIRCELHPVYFDQTSKNLTNFLFQKNDSLTWWHTTFYFAVTRYIIKTKGDLKYLNQWVRVISNLIYNTPIESPKLFKEACESIQDLIELVKNNNVYEALKDLDKDKINFFAEKQKDEEIKKAKLIIENPQLNWENTFISLENHNYLYGQIGFIFSLLNNETFEEFKVVSQKVSILFSEETMKDSTCLLFRSFLAQENCFFENGDVLTYPSNVRGTLRNRNENWRRFFENKNNILKDFISNNFFTEINIIDHLNVIINDFSDNGTVFSKLIKNSLLLTYPLKNHIRRYNKAFYLLSKTRIYSFFTEVFTYDWYKNNYEYCKQYNLEYKDGKGEGNNAGIFLKDNEERLLYYDRDIGKFVINANPKLVFDSIDEAINNIIS